MLFHKCNLTCRNEFRDTFPNFLLLLKQDVMFVDTSVNKTAECGALRGPTLSMVDHCTPQKSEFDIVSLDRE